MIRWLANRLRAALSDPVTLAGAGVILLSRGLSMFTAQIEGIGALCDEVREIVAQHDRAAGVQQPAEQDHGCAGCCAEAVEAPVLVDELPGEHVVAQADG